MYRTRFFQPLAIAGALATAVCSLARAAETRMLPLTPTIWEYRMAHFAENSEEQTVAMLNRLGAEGWELVSWTAGSNRQPPSAIGVFKRRVACLDSECLRAAHAIAQVERLGGTVSYGSDSSGSYVAGVALSNTGVKALQLALLQSFPRLTVVLLDGNPLTNVSTAFIGRLPRLRELDLSGCTLISDESLLDLAKLSELRSLRLAATSISDAGLQQLAPLRNLETLSIRYCNVKGVGLVSLAKLPNLKHLDLSGDEITDRGLESLKSLRGLRTLGLENTKVTAAGVRSLRQALPDCKITADDPGHAAKKTGISESAGQNRHGVADERAAWKRISEPIPTLSHAPDDGVTVAGLMPGNCPKCGCASSASPVPSD